MGEYKEITDSYDATVLTVVLEGLSQIGCTRDAAAGRVYKMKSNDTLHYIDSHYMFWLRAESSAHNRKPICLIGPALDSIVERPNNGRLVIYFGADAETTFKDMQPEPALRVQIPYTDI